MKRYYSVRTVLISLLTLFAMSCAKTAQKEKDPSDLIPLKTIEFPNVAPGSAPGSEDWKRLLLAFGDIQAHNNMLTEALNKERRDRAKVVTEIYENIAAVKGERKILFKEALTTDKLVWTMFTFSVVGFIVYARRSFTQYGLYLDATVEGMFGFITAAYISYSAAYLLSRLFTAQDSTPKK